MMTRWFEVPTMGVSPARCGNCLVVPVYLKSTSDAQPQTTMMPMGIMPTIGLCQNVIPPKKNTLWILTLVVKVVLTNVVVF